MKFKSRSEAGKLLADKLHNKYKNIPLLIYAIPRGGVVVGAEIANKLKAPLDLIITRKIGHPYNPEYALAAISESGDILMESKDSDQIDHSWLAKKIKEETLEAERRRKKYLSGKAKKSAQGKTAILIDDGVATGLTLRVGILELKRKNPKKIIVAVPVIARSTAEIIRAEIDDLIALYTPSDHEFRGAVGAYYQNFDQVEDEEVIKILKN